MSILAYSLNLHIKAADKKDMAKKHFLGMFLRLCGTVLLTVLLVVVVNIYQAKHNFTSAHKAAFGILMLALALFLGLNFLVSASQLALLDVLIPHTRKLSKS